MDIYSKCYRYILFPFYEGFLRNRNTLKHLKELEKSQWLPYEKLQEIQWNKLKSLLKHAYENVPFYKERFIKMKLHPDDIKTPQDFARVGFLTKDDIRSHHDRLIATNYKDKKVSSQVTGGSTGTPLHFKLDTENYRWRQAAIKRVYGWTGYSDGEKAVFIWGAPVVKQPFFKKIKHDLDERLKARRIYNTFYFTEKMMSKCIKEINSYKPKHIIAYATPLYNFAMFIRKNNKNIRPPISIIVGAEKLFPQQRKVIEEVFCCPVFETYGCREVTSIAGECEKHSGMHINMENIYLEIVKKDTLVNAGELGEIVITDLTNYAMPFIRYKNDDIGSISTTRCTCGRGLSMFDRIEGRVLDTIKTTEGRLIPGEFFIYWFMGFDEVKQFQVIQEDLDNLLIKIVKKDDLPKEKLEYLKKVIREVMGEKINIDFKLVDEISLTQYGKFRVVVSKVPIVFEKVASE